MSGLGAVSARLLFFFYKQKTAYDMRISDWSSDVCSSDLLNPRAVAIAELVLWIGYLQWHFRTRGRTMPAEPVLKNFENIRCQDAVLAYDGWDIQRDESGKPVTRWDGITHKLHPVTGEARRKSTRLNSSH